MARARLKLRTRLVLLLAFVLAGTLLAGGYGLWTLRQSQAAHDASLRTSEQLLGAVDSARSAQVSFKVQVHEFKNLLLRGHDQEQFDWYLAAFHKAGAGVLRDLDALQGAAGRLGMAAEAAAEARRMHAAIVHDHLEALKSFQRGSAESALATDRAVRGRDRQLDERIGGIVSELQKFSVAEAARLRQEEEERGRRAMLALLVLAAGVAAIASALGAALVRSLQRELGGEPDYAREVAGRIAAGDLTGEVELGRRDAGSVLFAMRDMRENLRALIGAVSQGAGTVAHTSAQIAQGNLDLSQRTEEQATTLEETASQMEEITHTVANNAEQARQARELAAQAAGLARRGGTWWARRSARWRAFRARPAASPTSPA